MVNWRVWTWGRSRRQPEAEAQAKLTPAQAVDAFVKKLEASGVTSRLANEFRGMDPGVRALVSARCRENDALLNRYGTLREQAGLARKTPTTSVAERREPRGGGGLLGMLRRRRLK